MNLSNPISASNLETHPSNLSHPSNHNPAAAMRLYLVTDAKMTANYGLIKTVCDAINGGITMVQLRDKHASDETLYKIASELKEAVNGRVPLVINDRVHIAKKAKLDGAHIGQGDISVDEARHILGKDAWLGLSINTEAELKAAHEQHVSKLDYFGIGPVFATRTKSNHAGPIGLDGLAYLTQLSQLPTVAIGGINQTNAYSVYQTGCDGIAVVSAICASDHPKHAAQQLLAANHA